MESVSTIFGSIIETDETHLQKILLSLDEHHTFWNEPIDEIENYFSKIGVLLNSSSTRQKGLLLLNNLLPQCPIEVLEEKLQNYMQICMKACNQKGQNTSIPVAFSVLKQLLLKSTDTAGDLNKIVISNVPKLLENISAKLDASAHLAALEFLETCMKHYSGVSGSMKNRIEEFVLSLVDSNDDLIVEKAGICLHLLQQIRGGGNHGTLHKKAWNEYQLKLIGSVHDLLSKVFSHTAETFDVNEDLECLKLPKLKLSDEPLVSSRQLLTRLVNLSKFLEITLVEPYPVAKPIQPMKILNLIFRGLSVNCSTLSKNLIMENISIGIFLPQIHEHLFSVLDALVLILRGNLLPFANMICEAFEQALKWTSTGRANGEKRSYLRLRSKIYESLSLWCQTMKFGSCIEEISDNLLGNIVQDISPYQNEVTMKAPPGGKRLSHKAKKRLQNIQNKASNLSKKYSTDNSIDTAKNLQSDKGNEALCNAALECLTNLLNAAGCFIKPVMQKLVQEKVVAICFGVVSESNIENTNNLYSSPDCRLNLFAALNALIVNPHHLCPPPLQYGVTIYNLAEMHDVNADVRNKSAEFMRNLETIIHPHKEVFNFPTEENAVKEAMVNKNKTELKMTPHFPAKKNYDGNRTPVTFEKVAQEEEGTIDLNGNDEKEDAVINLSDEDIVEVNEDETDGSGDDDEEVVHSVCSEDMEPMRVDEDDVQLIADDDVVPPPQMNGSQKKQKLKNNDVTTPAKKLKLIDSNDDVDAKVEDLVATFVDELNDDDF